MKSQNIVKFVIGFLVIAAGIGFFIYKAMQSSWSYYSSVDEYTANADTFKNYSLRLAGVVKPNTVNREMDKLKLDFILSGAKSEIPVSYTGTIPNNFSENGEVVVEGRVDAMGVFQADVLITKCESKYKAKVRQP